MGEQVIPPLPHGFSLDAGTPPLPAGFTMDAPAKAEPKNEPGFIDRVVTGVKDYGKFGLPGLVYGATSAFNPVIESAINEGGGRVTDAMSNMGASPSVAAGAGAVANAGMNAIPMLVGGGMGRAATPLMESASRSLMQKALKPGSKDLELGKADRAIQTMLDEGVNVSRGGMDKLRGMGNNLNTRAANEIAGSTATVNKYDVANRLYDTERRAMSQVNPVDDVAAVGNSWNEFLAHPHLTGRSTMPVQMAQELKQGTYKKLADSYGQQGNATVEAQKALARGLKEEIERGVPSVVPINARASEIWNALNVANRRALVGGNNNPAGLSLLANSPQAAAAFALDRSALAKSLLARGVYAGREAVPMATGAALGGAYGNYNQGK